MAKNRRAIYVTGLGDDKTAGHRLIQKLWRLQGLDIDIYMMDWSNGPFDAKLKGLLAKIDNLKASGVEVSLIGVSAGASAVLNAYVLRKNSITKVVFVCGKLANLENINPRYYSNNPAFKTSIEELKISLTKLSADDKNKLISLQPLADGIVYIPDTKILGVRNKRILAAGHVFSIIVAFLFYARFMIKFIKND